MPRERDAADAESGGELVLIESFTGGEFAFPDETAYLGGNLIAGRAPINRGNVAHWCLITSLSRVSKSTSGWGPVSIVRRCNVAGAGAGGT